MHKLGTQIGLVRQLQPADINNETAEHIATQERAQREVVEKENAELKALLAGRGVGVLGGVEAGADIAETNTFSGTWIAQADYALEKYVYDIFHHHHENLFDCL